MDTLESPVFCGNYLYDNGQWRRFYSLLSYTLIVWEWREHQNTVNLWRHNSKNILD